jgi:hypothetical protein
VPRHHRYIEKYRKILDVEGPTNILILFRLILLLIRNQKNICALSVCTYINIHTVYHLYVSATHAVICREVHYKSVHISKYYTSFRNQCLDTKYYILKIIRGLKYILKIKIQAKYVFFVMHLPEDGRMSGRKV